MNYKEVIFKMIQIITEEDNIVVFEPDVVMKTANDIMSLYMSEHERHRKQVGNIFNQYKSDLDKLTRTLDSEAQTYSNNIEQIRKQEGDLLSGKFGIHLMYQN